MSPLVLLATWCALMVLVSLAGGLVPLLMRLSHRRLEVLLSFASGVMLGAVFWHLLPAAGPLEPVAPWCLGGFLAMFFIERFFRFHHHDAPGEPPPHGHQHGHEHEHEHEPGRDHGHRLRWAGAAIGLTLHSLIEGVALAAATAEGAGGRAAGLAVFLAIAMHKPLDSLTLGTLMAAGPWTARARHLVNFAFGLAVPVGAALFMLGLGGQGHAESPATRAALAFSAGTFLCIALSDLLPELQFHQHDRVKLSAALLAGIALAWGAARVEKLTGEGDHVHQGAAGTSLSAPGRG